MLVSMFESDVVQPHLPIILVWKKDTSFRFCVYYHKINAVIHMDAYPFPRIDDTLHTLSGSKWFSTIDLCLKTAFGTTEDLLSSKLCCLAYVTPQQLFSG